MVVKERRKVRIALTALGLFALPSILGLGLFVLFDVRARPVGQGPVEYDPRVRHIVSEQMRVAAEARSRVPAPSFSAKGPDGLPHDLQELTAGGPLLLYFINVECPCSVDAEPMFGAFQRAYPELVVVGVANAVGDKTAEWGRKQHATHLLLADPQAKIAGLYGAVGSVYTALVDRRGRMVKLWPGYSKDMMAELSTRVAGLLGTPSRKLDPRLAPATMAAGCAFPKT